jgi:hypothetical protein
MSTTMFEILFQYFNLASIKTIYIDNTDPEHLTNIIKLCESRDMGKPFYNSDFYTQAYNYSYDVLSNFKNPYGTMEFISLDNTSNKYYLLIKSTIPFSRFFLKNISFELIYNKKNINTANRLINKMINNFINDEYYKNYHFQKRERFLTQMENFYKFINNSPIKQHIKIIPLSTLNETKFEIIKILKYLEIKKIITIDSWNETECWKITFHKDPHNQATYFPPIKPSSNETQPNMIRIDKDGAIFRDNLGLSYLLGTNNRQYVIIAYLTKKKVRIKTEIISLEAPPPNIRNTNKQQEPQEKNKSTREAIGKINKSFKDNLKIDDFITNKQGMWYKINEKYQIIIEKINT